MTSFHTFHSRSCSSSVSRPKTQTPHPALGTKIRQHLFISFVIFNILDAGSTYPLSIGIYGLFNGFSERCQPIVFNVALPPKLITCVQVPGLPLIPLIVHVAVMQPEQGIFCSSFGEEKACIFSSNYKVRHPVFMPQGGFKSLEVCPAKNSLNS